MVEVIQTKEEFDQALAAAGGKLVVVDFYADWCGPCRMFAPTFQRLSGEYTNVVFLKVNTDEVQELASKYGIRALPTFMFFKNGERVDEVTGASESKVVEKLKTLS